MKINNIDITKTDFNQLLEILKTIDKLNDTGNKFLLSEMVKPLITNLENNLMAEEETELKIHDKVEIIATDDYELNEYVGEQGWIIKIDEIWEYPYEVEFEDKTISNDWLWKKEHLKLI